MGIVAGVGAIVFYVATRAAEHYALGVVAGYYPEPRPGGEPSMAWLPAVDHPLRLWLLLVVPTVGGLLSGILVFTLAPEAEGHGTDSAISAYHNHQGQIRPRVPLVKIIASALTLGTGGSGGREGPIAQIGAGFGSVLGNLLRLRPAERRVLMAAGMGSGIGAIFRAPLAGTMFAAEVLYRSPEFEPEVIIPTGIASVISYCVFGAYSGWEPLFNIPDLKFTNPWQLGPYLVLAIFMALLAMLYTRTFYGCKRLFDRLPIPRHFRPAIGALLTGLVAVCLYGLASCFMPSPAQPGAPRPGTASVGGAGFRLFRDPRCGQAGHERRGFNSVDDRIGKDRYDWLDNRERGLGRRLRSVDGDRRLWRWGVWESCSIIFGPTLFRTRRVL